MQKMHTHPRQFLASAWSGIKTLAFAVIVASLAGWLRDGLTAVLHHFVR